jgi:uncharacterized protein YdiU (UPF0061 family)
MKTLEQLEFDNSYARLPEGFWSRHKPQPLDDHYLVHFNRQAADLIELDHAQAERPDFVDIISAASPLPDYDTIAACYAGHQFGHYVPRLGDGRAILLGEVKTSANTKWDLQLKGGGQTLYSRQGDGRAVLRSTIREYLCSEAMHGLGIPTTRALCITGSGEEVYREQIETGAMLLRMAPSHVRFGNFEYFYYSQQYADLKTLSEYVLGEHFTHLLEHDNPTLAMLDDVIDSTANLIAHWQSVGFAHGVMNTDNMSILGLTLDYGPYGFLDSYEPGFICNHSDHHGRYAFNRQPEIGLFNLSCLAQALLPLIHDSPEQAAELATASLQRYQPLFEARHAQLMRAKLGLKEDTPVHDAQWQSLLVLMEQDAVDYTILFRTLSDSSLRKGSRDLFVDREAFDAWLAGYERCLEVENRDAGERDAAMKACNPVYVLRNHLAETAIRMAEDDRDYTEIDRLMQLLQNPFDDHAGFEAYAGHPPEWASRIEVSCSS